MTESKRSNAAGEKYALRGIYGSEPYWPQEKLKICVTGAGGFIGARFLSFFFVPFLFPGRRPLRDRAVLARSFSLSLFVETRERETFPFVNLCLCFCVVIERAVLNRFITLSLSLSFIEWSRRRLGDLLRDFFGDRSRKKNQRLTALLSSSSNNPLFKTTR